MFSTQPYKGTRDFYPEDLRRRQYIFDTWKKTLSRCGFVEYDASIIENADMYIAKSGEELGSQQLYNFKDKGDRHIALRPEMTPTLARIVAAKMGELKFPLRWFSIPNCFRYERPQRGRLREFWQLNADIVGLEAGAVDIEILSVAGQLFLEFGVTRKQFKIMFNHRQVLEKWLTEYASISSEKHAQVYAVLDDWHKVSISENTTQLLEFLSQMQVTMLTDLAAKTGQAWQAYLDIAQQFNELKMILDVIPSLSQDIEYDFNPTIIRGLAYYTGIVFEAFDMHPDNPRAMFGGGRYDDLLDLFGKKAPAVGIGVGDVTWSDFLDTWDLWPDFSKTETQPVGIIVSSPEKLTELYSTILPDLAAKNQSYDINYQYDRNENKRYQALKKRGCNDILHI